MEKFKAIDGKAVYYRRWLPDKKPVAVVQIAHGMAEHSGCYAELAEFLLKRNLAVYCHDHRGHGKTAGNRADYGFIADKNGWELLVEDMISFTDLIKNQHPGIPYFVYGHNMGSLITQSFISKRGNVIDGVILSGVPVQSGLLQSIGKMIARYEIKKFGARHRSKRLSDLTFGNYNKKFKPVLTAFDWLSRDQQKVQEYVDDQWCGGTFTSVFFLDLLSGAKSIWYSERLFDIEHDLAFLFLTGECDAVNSFSKGIWNLIDFYERHGFYDVEAVFYPECRHDLKLELNREMIFTDIVTWIAEKLKYFHQ
jgi:alpha-beta hydrolase superfamily lysophospholipase